MAKGNSAFSPANGSSRDDVGDRSCYHVPADEPNLMARDKGRQPFGGKPGGLADPMEGGWVKQGHMVQPLPDGFSFPSLAAADVRRDEFELNDSDNFDPIQGMPPRLKRLKDSE